MKLSRIAVAFFGLALFFSVSAFAGDENKGTLRLQEKVTVAGTALNPGDYRVEWSGSGPDVQVKLIKGHDTVATFPAKVAEQKVPVTANGYGQDADSNALTAIYFGGKHYSLQVPPTAAQQSNPQGNSGASK